MNAFLKVATAVGALALSACATLPEGPSYAAMPGSRKSFDQFQFDDASCRQYGTQAIGGATPSEAANNAAVGSAVVGTALGAAIGGLLGGHDGAAVGAGMGLFTGAAVGAGNSQAAGYSAQHRYDNAYYQCMYGLGNRVPAPAGYVSRSAAPAVAARSGPPPNAAIPPPDAPPPNRSPSSAPPPNAATPPPDTPPPYRLPR